MLARCLRLITVSTRAMFLRTVLLIRLVWVTIGLHVHAGDLARGTTGNLLDTKTEEFLAELSHLVEKVHLGLVLEILGANLGLVRVSTCCPLMYRSASISHYRRIFHGRVTPVRQRHLMRIFRVCTYHDNDTR